MPSPLLMLPRPSLIPRPSSSHRASSFVAVVALLALAGGCAHRDRGPADVVAAFERAVADGRMADAYALMSDDYKKSHDADAFSRSFAPADRAAAARWKASAVELRAEVKLADGETLPLVEEGGAWRFARDPLDLYPQRAPDEALRSFLRAVDHQRWDVLVRFVPSRFRAQVTADAIKARWQGERKAELAQQLANIRAHLDEPLEQSGDDARLVVGEHKEVKLVREDGAWKIDHLE
jgi:hypothetical protein